MFCTNCGKQVEDNASFCTNCGAKLTPAEPVAPVAEPVAPVAEPVAPAVEPVAPVAEPVAPVAEPAAPVAEPAAPVAEPVAPVAEPVPTAFDPMTGQPVAAPVQKTNPFQPFVDTLKKIKPLYYAIAGGVVALIIVISIVISIISGSGINGVLANMEKAINDGDSDALEKCYPAFVFEEKDIDVSDIKSALGAYYDDFEVEFELVKEKDVTDEDHDYMDCTWQEYIQEKYEDYDEYDGEEVEAVVKAKVKMEMDFDNSVADLLADVVKDNMTQEFTFVKVDGDWYIYD